MLNWGFSIDLVANLNLSSLVLLGISGGVTISAGIVSKAQQSPAGGGAPVAKALLNSTSSFWPDILMDDKGEFSVVRLQQLLFTVVYIVIYVSYFFGMKMRYPDFDQSAFVLMGISTGTYVLGKSLNK